MNVTLPRSHWKQATSRIRAAGAACLALAVSIALAAGATAARAATAAGEVVAMDGTGEIERGGAKLPLTLGTAVEVGDRVRTHTAGRVRLLFSDGSTLVLGEGSDLRIDEHVFDPSGGKTKTLLRVLEGKVRALVSEYYGDRSASYEIETPGAVAGVRGTEFIVEYDADRATSDIATFQGAVAVRSLADRAAEGVLVSADKITSVKNGRPPAPPRPLSASDKVRYLEALQLSGIGEAGATLAEDPVLGGREVPPSEAGTGRGAGRGGEKPAGVGDEPGGRAATPGDSAGQPIPALEGPGQIGVPF